ncbi:hypothetical protein [Rufibacter sp. LB8]|uniref:hypothetical protein n=2 Tax=Rufibacter sp. LB8 TaxID=2777781 RepID=UPI00178C283D|nr:hypothetical protein [Rufibacter sp. LB8]
MEGSIKMKNLIVILISILPFCSFSQTYSSIIPDKDILDFVQWEISNVEKYDEDRPLGRKKLFKRPRHWRDADIGLISAYGDTVTFNQKLYPFLKDDSIFSPEDLEFLELQFNSQQQNEWASQLKRVNLKKRFGLNTHEVTIPLFSQDKTLVIFWKYFYCGSLCAHSCTFIYKRKEDNSWELVKTFGCWIS